MGFLDDVLGAFSGQQATPQQTIIPTGDLLGQASGLLTSQIAPATIAYNQALAGPLTDIQLGVERQYNPYAFDVRSGAYKSILDELNLGNTVPAELQDLVTQRTLEGNTASGAGTSNLGDIFGARSLLSAGLDLGRQRRMDALGAASASPSLNELYQPRDPTNTLFGIAQDIRGVQAAEDEYANIVENTRRQNFGKLLSTGFRIAGGVAGGIFGGPMGAQMGMSAGGSIIPGSTVAGYGGQASGGGGNPFASILSGIGGPQWGIGSQSGGGGGGGLGGSNWGLEGTMFAS